MSDKDNLTDAEREALAKLRNQERSERGRTVYVKHPCPPELKAKLRAEGKKILDARFAPKGASVIDPSPKESKAPAKTGKAPPKKGAED